MLERKRLAKNYQAVPGEDDADLELGEGSGIGAQESGTTGAGVSGTHPSLDQEVDNWDENIEDGWDDDEHLDSAEGEGLKTPSASSAGDDLGESKKRGD